MQHNLKRGLSLALSLVLLTGTMSACNRVSNPPASPVSENSSKQPAADGDNESPPAPTPAADKSGSGLAASQHEKNTKPRRPQIDVPPPPLGIVPVSSVRRSNHSTSGNTAEAAFDPPMPAEIRTAHRTYRSDSPSTGLNRDQRVTSQPQTNVNRSRVTVTPTRQLTATEQASVAERKQRLKEQEMIARKLVQERAAHQEQSRQARLTAKRGGNPRAIGSRGSNQMARAQ
ncbi:MAG: hypothetical protein JWM11_5795 [Planctomycetaceae bacterium]|nr:hypothetical protein [Planctomycetaceae bacterium]